MAHNSTTAPSAYDLATRTWSLIANFAVRRCDSPISEPYDDSDTMSATFQSEGGMKIAVVIPCYRVRSHILDVIERIDASVAAIYVVDDCCPEGSGDYVERLCVDPRVKVIRHAVNQGVGGAVMTGYLAAVEAGMEVAVKIDGDGQMDPALLAQFVAPIIEGWADYTKGNRFYDLRQLHSMPALRLLGNAVLSLMAKVSSGYWNIFDPTNGYTAINTRVAAHLPLDKLSKRYFFETDMLFRLNTLRAVVADIPMDAVYGEEVSNLKIKKIVGEFAFKHLKNSFKRIFYNYFLRDFNAASLELVFGVLFLIFGVSFGSIEWSHSVSRGVAAPVGTIILAALPTIFALQLLLAFVNYDVAAVPVRPIARFLPRKSNLEIDTSNAEKND